jgi:hypothetical protein
MNWVKDNAMPLLVGVAVGYFLAKRGGVMGAVSSVKGTAKSVASG